MNIPPPSNEKQKRKFSNTGILQERNFQCELIEIPNRTESVDSEFRITFHKSAKILFVIVLKDVEPK